MNIKLMPAPCVWSRGCLFRKKGALKKEKGGLKKIPQAAFFPFWPAVAPLAVRTDGQTRAAECLPAFSIITTKAKKSYKISLKRS